VDQCSGVPRILEWELGVQVPQASRGVESEVSPPYWGKGLCPLSRKFFVLFVKNTIF